MGEQPGCSGEKRNGHNDTNHTNDWSSLMTGFNWESRSADSDNCLHQKSATTSPDQLIFREKEARLRDDVLETSGELGARTTTILTKIKALLPKELNERKRNEAEECINQIISIVKNSYGENSDGPDDVADIDTDHIEKPYFIDALLGTIEKHYPSQFQNNYQQATDSDYISMAEEKDSRLRNALNYLSILFPDKNESFVTFGRCFEDLEKSNTWESDFAEKTFCVYLNSRPSDRDGQDLIKTYKSQVEEQSEAIKNLAGRLKFSGGNNEIVDNLYELAHTLRQEKSKLIDSVIRYITFKTTSSNEDVVTDSHSNDTSIQGPNTLNGGVRQKEESSVDLSKDPFV